MNRVKAGLIFICCVCALAQGWGRREARQPWLTGRFAEAEQEFAQRQKIDPRPHLFLWEADYEIERARYGRAAALIKDAKKYGTSDSDGLPEKRQARLLLAVGQFLEAQKEALAGRKWDGKDVTKLRVSSVIDLVTLGEIALARGDFAKAIPILEKARNGSKNVSALFGDEWIRANDDIAVADIGLGSTGAAILVSALALSAAEREWGADSIPATDSRDALGLAQISQGDFKNAEMSLNLSRSRREALYGDNPKTAESYIHAALLCSAQDQLGNAVRLLERGLEIQKAIAAGPNGRWALALLAGAEIYTKAGRKAEATDCYASAIPVLERELGPDAPRLEIARKHYNELRGM
jgi:tetratricopeptide (TPR) repeat protein